MIKTWLITASAPICGTDTTYLAFCEDDPLEKENFPYDEIIEDLWDNYSMYLNLDDEEYSSEEERDEAYEQAREDWNCDCSFESEELDDPDDLKEYLESSDIIYDERK